MLSAEVDQHDLQGRKERVGEQYSEQPKQRGHQQLHREQNRRRDVDSAPGDVGQHHVTFEIVDKEVDEDRPNAVIRASRETDRDHQDTADDGTDVRDEGEDASQ